MPSDFAITGADQFLTLSKALKASGRTQLRKDLNKGLRVAAKPMIALNRAAALEQLPKRGGLAKQVAKSPQRVQTRTGANPGVRLVVTKRSGVRATNRGVIRHPVFADPRQTRDQWAWVSQRVTAGWFDATNDHNKVLILPGLKQVIDDMNTRIAREMGG